MASSKKSSSSSSAAAPQQQDGVFSGIVNPSGFAMAAFAGVFAAFIPVTTYLAKPNGWVDSAMGLSLKLVPGYSSTSATVGAALGQGGNRQIAALATMYVFFTMAATGAFSVAGQASGRSEFDNNMPRQHTSTLRGFPLRLYSAHHNLVENFPLWAVAAAFTQVMAPSSQIAVNLLSLAALTKIFVYYPAYLLDVSPVRSLCHLIHTSAVVNVLWKLSTGDV